MAINVVALRVSHGVRVLNEKYPNWKERVKINLLDMSSSTNGLLEQLYDSHAQGVHALGIGLHEADDYGFDIKYDRSDEQNIRQWQTLTEAWKQAIAEFSEVGYSDAFVKGD